MKITSVVIQRFREWLKELVESKGVDPALLGLTTWSDEAVRKFIEEYCSGLNYEECKTHILDVFPILKKGVNIDEDLLSMVRQDLEQIYGTPYISEAFKIFCSRYTYEQIQDMLRDVKGTELEDFYNFATAKYGAVDIDVRRAYEIKLLGIRFHHVKHGSIELFFKQMMMYQKFRPAKKIDVLMGHGEELLIAHKNSNALILIAIIDYDENILLPITQSEKNQYMAVFNKANRRGALIY